MMIDFGRFVGVFMAGVILGVLLLYWVVVLFSKI